MASLRRLRMGKGKGLINAFGRPSCEQDAPPYVAWFEKVDWDMLAGQCSVARAILDLTVAQLAEKADVTADIILRIEAGAALDEASVVKVREALETEGIEFTFGDRPGVRVRTLDGVIEVSAGKPAKPNQD